MKAWGRLLRISLFATAVADVVGGLLLSGGGSACDARTLALLVAGSLCVFHGSLAFNDWCDRAVDARAGRDRPLVTGAIRPAQALVAGALLIGVGVCCAALVGRAPGLWLAALALLATIYNAAGRGPLKGPLLLAACRAGNLSLGIVWAWQAGVLSASPWRLAALPLVYALYLVAVARLGRLEDSEDPDLRPERPRRLLLASAALLLCAPLVPVGAWAGWGRVAAAAVALCAALGLYARARSAEAWTCARVGASMGLALRRLFVFGTVACLLPGTTTGFGAAAVLCLLTLVGYGLRRPFPPPERPPRGDSRDPVP